ncbi:flagellar biosynthesis protein FlhB [Celerinatantimonas diazotrophica]|uniref:Flagellar biosynthetic protein FlhB n=1 Tax=Celerinatantimonas diazotrophica TaxID=412034 RepID=A0A4R1JM21_9GAMM|nr:flagellar biosynthesis protein FlhB [Celerinatantimonas diazotrophica]TCK52122.1 flagellar biosynthetic protein FlhB [Celerinatantimonas diazotrophica]CAG9296173.1 Flagellar biosynthetic protein FlhB [Celerinatantimonas diazotrophica]
MAESDQERTEQPTEKRLSEAREKGQIARSKELATALVLIGSAVALMLVGGELATAIALVMKTSFSLDRAEVFDPHLMLHGIGSMLLILVKPMAWIMVIILIAGLIGNTLLGGVAFSWQAAAPKFNRLSPLSGFKRMFGIQAVVELAKGIAKVLVIALAVWWIFKAKFGTMMNLSMQTLPGSIDNALHLLQWLFFLMTLSLLLIAAIDVPFQRWNHVKQLKMTKQEIKDEHKNTEGNPEIKGRIRRLQMEMTNRRMMADVPQADVVITNPTHYSVALKYDSEQAGAPIVVAKGADVIAFKIREIAQHYEIPVLESPAVTRSLYHTTKVGAQIPDGLFVAVAQILAYVFQLEQFNKGQASRPRKPSTNLPIPDELQY